MRIAFFVHSLLSDWNHGNAHFLRGVVTELQCRGHEVRVFEPAAAWSPANLAADHGAGMLDATRVAYPGLEVHRYDEAALDLDEALDGVAVAVVHEWNTHALVRRVGAHRRRSRGLTLLFHDTHHRSVSEPQAMAAYDLSHYDGVLAFGEVIRECYLRHGWASRAWTWHEAADTRVFRPLNLESPHEGGLTRVGPLLGDLVWIGNWGDEERTAELREFLVEPVRRLRLRARVHGVRYPAAALDDLRRAGVSYEGWLPNYRVPEVFARHRVTVHIPRRPYVESLPGVPTIRPFEAMACGIPLVTAPWHDAEHLFTAGRDFLVARNGVEMERHLRDLLHDSALAGSLARHGLRTIRARHTCRHRTDELLAIVATIQGGAARYEPPVERATV